MFYPYGKSFRADFVPSALSPLPPGAPLKNPSSDSIKPLFAPFSLMLFQVSFVSHPPSISPLSRKCADPPVELSQNIYCQPYFPASPRSTLSPTSCYPHSSMPPYFERALRLSLSFSLVSLAYCNPCTRLRKGSWRSFSIYHNLTPNLQLPRKPLILCPPKPPWSTSSSFSYLMPTFLSMFT